jgi:hypothetical protein
MYHIVQRRECERVVTMSPCDVSLRLLTGVIVVTHARMMRGRERERL